MNDSEDGRQPEPDAWRWKTKHQGWRLNPCKWNVGISGDTDIEAEDLIQQEPLWSGETIQKQTIDARKKLQLVIDRIDSRIKDIEIELDHDCFNVKGTATDVCDECMRKREMVQDRDRLEIAKHDLEEVFTNQ